MVLEGLSSPHRRTTTPFSPPALKKPLYTREELGDCMTLVRRHSFLLTTMILLFLLCTVYLYFAVTLDANGTCSDLTGAEKALCRLDAAKASLAKGKLKYL